MRSILRQQFNELLGFFKEVFPDAVAALLPRERLDFSMRFLQWYMCFKFEFLEKWYSPEERHAILPQDLILSWSDFGGEFDYLVRFYKLYPPEVRQEKLPKDPLKKSDVFMVGLKSFHEKKLHDFET